MRRWSVAATDAGSGLGTRLERDRMFLRGSEEVESDDLSQPERGVRKDQIAGSIEIDLPTTWRKTPSDHADSKRKQA